MKDRDIRVADHVLAFKHESEAFKLKSPHSKGDFRAEQIDSVWKGVKQPDDGTRKSRPKLQHVGKEIDVIL